VGCDCDKAKISARCHFEIPKLVWLKVVRAKIDEKGGEVAKSCQSGPILWYFGHVNICRLLGA
jgi:hypothetical protein